MGEASSHHHHGPAMGRAAELSQPCLRTTDTEQNVKDTGLGVTQARSCPALPLTSCATPSKAHHHSEPHFPHL